MDKILNYLPENVAECLGDYAEARGLTDLQVLELALASFLNLDEVSFGEVEKYESVGMMRERLAILEMQLRAAREQGFPDLPDVLKPPEFLG